VTTTTAAVVDLITSARLPRGNSEHAQTQLSLFAEAAKAGADSRAATELRRIAPAGQDPLWQAWINATAAMAAEYRPVWVAVCAVATALGQEADDIADAVAIGYEVADRLASDLAGAADGGWSAAAVADRIGAAAAAARALRLPAAAARNTVGLSATQATGLSTAEGAAGELQMGKAAADAIEAAFLSRCGFTSPPESLEGRRGLFALLNVEAVNRLPAGGAQREFLPAGWPEAGSLRPSIEAARGPRHCRTCRCR
jgi:2-methylcitrate dehydratase PrpD